jgi:putative transposase
VHCGRKRVARLMRQANLVGVHSRRRWRRGGTGEATAPDLVQRDFNPAGPDQVWAADVTQIRTGEGWLFLAAVLDLWSRRVLGWSMGTSATAELVSEALVMAASRRRPDRRVVHHSDRGAAYTSLLFSQRLTELGLDQSFGKTGDCYDKKCASYCTSCRWIGWKSFCEAGALLFDQAKVAGCRRLEQP